MKKIFWLGLYLSLCSCNFFKEKKVSTELYTQIDCQIFDPKFEIIAHFTGYICAFDKNGDWAAIQDDKLVAYDKNNIELFRLPDRVHHEVKYSHDGNKIFFLSSEIQDFKNIKTRFDVINVIDRQGKKIGRWSTFDHIKELYDILDLYRFDKNIPNDMNDVRYAPLVRHEFSHLNAIYELPKNDLEETWSFMKEGNLLVTFNGLGGVAVFDPELKKLLHIFTKFRTDTFGFHEAQILENGHMILFKNVNRRGPVEIYTKVLEYDLLNEKEVWSFEFKKPTFDFNEINGSIQFLNNGNFFLGENSFGGRAVEIDRDGNIIWQGYNEFDRRTKRPHPIYRAKKMDLSGFLKNNMLGAWSRKNTKPL